MSTALLDLAICAAIMVVSNYIVAFLEKTLGGEQYGWSYRPGMKRPPLPAGRPVARKGPSA